MERREARRRAETLKGSEVRKQRLDEYAKEMKKEPSEKNEDREMMVF